MILIRTFKQALLCLLILMVSNVTGRAQSIFAYGYSFTALSKPYTYLSGGTPLTSIQVDDGYTTIPIGFTFTFCGVDYNDVTICSNGWIRFGTGPGVAPANWNYNPTPSSSPYPAVYFLYEDISASISTAQYKVTGSAPNRVFTFELRNIAWDYLSTSGSVSSQVNLYETTGVIECMYKQEAGTVALNSSGGATMGIQNTVADYQVLDGVGAAPTSSSTVWTGTLGASPATDQCYKWDPGPPCNGPATITMTNVASKSATFTWSAITGTGNYEYIVDQLPGSPTGAGTATLNNNAGASGLTPSTNYYVHVRYKCSSVSFSKWTTVNFTTRPDCSKPGAVTIIAIDTNSVTLQWPAVAPAVTYEYFIDQSRSTPASGAGASTSASSVINKTGLTEGTWYYVHYRSLCLGNDSSAWALDSFRTPIPCRKPKIEVTYLSKDNSVVSWPAVPTAYKYEYYLGPVATLPPNGTPILTTYIQTPYLLPGTGYTMNVRCNCDYFGAKSVSPWSSLDFTTLPPTGISSTNNKAYEVLIFPNPTKDKFTLSAKGIGAQGATVQISDINGKLMKAMDITQEYTDINVAGFPSGVYLLKYTDSASTKTIKLLVQ